MTRPGWETLWQAEAVLLEVDGVVVDTRAASRSAWHWWAGHVGIDPEVVATVTWGVPDRAAVEHLLPAADVEAAVTAIRDRRRTLLRTARRVRGAVSLVRSLPPARWAIVTSASSEHLELLLRRARLQAPAVVVTADDPVAGRPVPAAHVAAAEQLGYEPSGCLAIESSPAGVAAARTIDAATLAVGPRELHAALAGADAVRSDLGGVMARPLDDGRVEIRAFREPRIVP